MDLLYSAWNLLSAFGNWVTFAYNHPGWAIAIGLTIIIAISWLIRNIVKAPFVLVQKGFGIAVRGTKTVARVGTPLASSAKGWVTASKGRHFAFWCLLASVLLIGGLYWHISDIKPNAKAPGELVEKAKEKATETAKAAKEITKEVEKKVKEYLKFDLMDPAQFAVAEEYVRNWNRGYWEAKTIAVNRKAEGGPLFAYLIAEPPNPMPIPWTGVMPFAKAILKITKANTPLIEDLTIPIIGMTNYSEDGQIKPGTVFYSPAIVGLKRLKLEPDGKIELVIEEIRVPIMAHDVLETIKDKGEETTKTLWNLLKEEKKEWFDQDPLGKKKP